MNQKVLSKDGNLFVVTNGREYIVNDIISVKFSDLNKLNEKYKVVRYNILNYADIKLSDNYTFDSMIIDLETDKNILSIDYNAYGEYNSIIPNDSCSVSLWHLSVINAYDAWTITTGNPNVKIAVLDSGIDWIHPDLGIGNDTYQNIFCNQIENDWTNQNIPTSGNHIDDDANGYIDDFKGWNFDANSNDSRGVYYHGTFVAGIIGAKTNNHVGIAGIAGGNHDNGAAIIPYCVGLYYPNSAIIDDAIIAAVENGANVIQFSLSCVNTNAIVDAIQYATENGVSIICASGNENSVLSFPASNPNVIAVGAVDSTKSRAYFSNYGNNLSVVAPGVDIFSLNLTTSTDMYKLDSGTSFAAPQVSAIVALMLSVNPYLSINDIRLIIESTAQKVGSYTYSTTSGRPNGTWNNEMGYGLVDAYAAVQEAQRRHIQNTTYVSGTSIVEYYPEIFAGYSVTNAVPYGNVVVKSGSNITFKATDKIHLKPGFHVERGATFHAYIEQPQANTMSAPALMRRNINSEENPPHQDSNNNKLETNEIFSLSPNPATNVLNVESAEELSSITIYTLSGQPVLQTTDTEINVSAFPAGMYIVRAITTTGEQLQSKFIKQ
ncbi:MAG: S8 family peptidase [Paludibacteraceae bacterium]|nr:S8 family peptidase [Paludibacteraceae bacterium]